MEYVKTVETECPYCWERIELVIDCSVIYQEYIEDCEVCCRPISVSVAQAEDGSPQVEVRRENE